MQFFLLSETVQNLVHFLKTLTLYQLKGVRLKDRCSQCMKRSVFSACVSIQCSPGFAFSFWTPKTAPLPGRGEVYG